MTDNRRRRPGNPKIVAKIIKSKPKHKSKGKAQVKGKVKGNEEAGSGEDAMELSAVGNKQKGLTRMKRMWRHFVEGRLGNRPTEAAKIRADRIQASTGESTCTDTGTSLHSVVLDAKAEYLTTGAKVLGPTLYITLATALLTAIPPGARRRLMESNRQRLPFFRPKNDDLGGPYGSEPPSPRPNPVHRRTGTSTIAAVAFIAWRMSVVKGQQQAREREAAGIAS
ncbi:hypothetical protein QBC46DRAFT_355695 [Diplogelasinospora grovesii]|uniref:Uncharacterized protein n=1 Tax=Diplogelasinospora grovesii TaxID=303347 RepID=A0AAN6N576_9PEZI|nr:hypothetical protein QBC46DRAFT_355695 [Diplogelasinospora grovesii]